MSDLIIVKIKGTVKKGKFTYLADSIEEDVQNGVFVLDDRMDVEIHRDLHCPLLKVDSNASEGVKNACENGAEKYRVYKG